MYRDVASGKIIYCEKMLKGKATYKEKVAVDW
jgi:hypothetical protein